MERDRVWAVRLVLFSAIVVMLAASAMLAAESPEFPESRIQIVQVDCGGSHNDMSAAHCVEHHLHALQPYYLAVRSTSRSPVKSPILDTRNLAKNYLRDIFRPPAMLS